MICNHSLFQKFLDVLTILLDRIWHCSSNITSLTGLHAWLGYVLVPLEVHLRLLRPRFPKEAGTYPQAQKSYCSLNDFMRRFFGSYPSSSVRYLSHLALVLRHFEFISVAECSRGKMMHRISDKIFFAIRKIDFIEQRVEVVLETSSKKSKPALYS